MSHPGDLPPGPSNWATLTPISFLARTAEVYPRRIGIIHGQRRFNWAEVHERCRRFASALQGRGIGRGDTVAVMAPNVPLLLEAHFAVPMAGAVLNAINTRLDPQRMEWLLAELAKTEHPTSCPHGRPIALRYSWKDIQRAFQRI